MTAETEGTPRLLACLDSGQLSDVCDSVAALLAYCRDHEAPSLNAQADEGRIIFCQILIETIEYVSAEVRRLERIEPKRKGKRAAG